MHNIGFTIEQIALATQKDEKEVTVGYSNIPQLAATGYLIARRFILPLAIIP